MEVWYRVGSKDEWDGVRGMAHMFEHMMFRGSKKYNGEGDVYIHEMEKLGSGRNICSRKIDGRKMNRRKTSSRGLYFSAEHFSASPDFCRQTSENLLTTTKL